VLPFASPSRPEGTIDTRAHILFVEDNKADIFLVEEALLMHGVDASIHTVMDGEAAIRYISRAEVDEVPAPQLVLLDLNLPKKSGQDVLAYIRGSQKFADLPVLIVTSSDAQIDRTRTSNLGASGFFKKPSSYNEFLDLGKLVKDLLPQKPGI